MADSTLRVIVDGRAAASGSQVVIQSIEGMTRSAKQGKDEMAKLQDSLESMGNAASKLGSYLKTVISFEALFEAGRALFEVTNKLQGFVSTMSVVTGNAKEARQELDYLIAVANRWGVGLDSLTGSYSKMAAASKGTVLEGKALKDIFESITMASSAMHLSTQDTTLVFFALQQMVSKGKVSMEELRKQLAERFPGAVQLAADSLGVTVDQLEKMVRAGKVLTADFLPNFAKKIKESFTDAAEVSSKSLLSEFQRLGNAWEVFQIKFSESSVISEVSETIRILTDMMTGNIGAATQLGDTFGDLIRTFNTALKDISPKQLSDSVQVAIDIFNGFVWVIKLVINTLDFLGPAFNAALIGIMEFIRQIKEVYAGILFTIKAMNALDAARRAEFQPMKDLWAEYNKGAATGIHFSDGVAEAYARVKEAQDKLNAANDKAIENQARAYVNNYNQYIDGQRDVAIKLKQVSATERLRDIEAQRKGLLETALGGTDGTADGLARKNAAMVAFNATNKEYVEIMRSLKKEQQGAKPVFADYSNEIQKLSDKLSQLGSEGDGGYPNLFRVHEKYLESMRKGEIQDMKQVQAMHLKAAALDEETNQLKTNADVWKSAEEQYKLHTKYQEDAEKASYNTAKAIKDQNDQLELEHATLNMSTTQRAAYIAQLTLAKLGVEGNTNAVMLLNKQLELLAQKEADTNAIAAGSWFSDQFKAVEDGLTDALMRAFENGDSFADAFKSTLVNAFKTMILRPAISMIMSPIASMGMGAMGFSQNSAGNWIGGGSSILSDASSLSSLWSNFGSTAFGPVGTGLSAAAYSTFGGAGSAQAAALAAQTAEFGAAGTGATLSALGGFGTILGPLIAAAPYVAAFVAIAGIAYSVFGQAKGAPKTGGYALSGSGMTPWDRGTHFTPNSADSEMQAVSDKWVTGLTSTVEALGGTADKLAAFDIGYDTDPGGTANNRLGVRASVGGKQVYNYWSGDDSLGRDSGVLQARMQLESKRALLAALQSSELPQQIAAVFNTMTASSATEAEIDNIIAFGSAMKAVKDSISGDVMKDAQDAWNSSQELSVTKLQNMGAEVVRLAQAQDGTTQSMQQLSQATTQYRSAVTQVLLDIEKMKSALVDMFAGTRTTLELIGLSSDDQYDYWQRKIVEQQAIIATSNDPYQINKATGLINTYFNNQLSAMSPERLAEMKNPLLLWWGELESWAQGRMTAAGGGILGDTQTPFEEADQALTDAAGLFKDAASDQQDAADTMVDAANKLSTAVDRFTAAVPITVNVRYPALSEVNG